MPDVALDAVLFGFVEDFVSSTCIEPVIEALRRLVGLAVSSAHTFPLVASNG